MKCRPSHVAGLPGVTHAGGTKAISHQDKLCMTDPHCQHLSSSGTNKHRGQAVTQLAFAPSE